MKWLSPDEAAYFLGVDLAHLRVIAHRNKWRREYHPNPRARGRIVKYALDDVWATRDNRMPTDT